jgi:hypothetical protein
MKYEYHIYGSRCGGEHTIGTIPKKVAEYWSQQGADAFEEYMLNWEHEELNEGASIPKEYQLPNWYELDDIDHMCSIEFHEGNIVTVTDITNQKEDDMPWVGNVIAEIPMTEDKIGSFIDEVAKAPNKDDFIVYGQSFEKGICSFETLKIDEPFDASKLKFDVAVWDDLYLVSGLIYDDKYLANEGMEGETKSMACWIDD